MKISKTLPIIFAVFLCLFGMTLTADAQRRRTTRRTSAATRNAAAAAATNVEIKSSAEKVSVQIKNLTRFIYLLGGIARSIEDIDRDARTGKFSRTTVSKNETNKQNVIASIKNLRAGLAALEVEFRVKPALRKYLFQVQGVTDTSGQAEDAALAGRFIESGKVLLTVVEKLSDTLVALP